MKGSLPCKNYQNMRLKTEVSQVAVLRVSQGEFCLGQGARRESRNGEESSLRPHGQGSNPLRERRSSLRYP